MTLVSSLDPEIMGNDLGAPSIKTAVLDEAHLGDIHGALGTIAKDDHGPRSTFGARLKTLIAVVGPGLIVMSATTTLVRSGPIRRPARTTARHCCGP